MPAPLVPVPALVDVPVPALVAVPVPVLVAVPLLVVVELVVVVWVGSEALLEADVGTVNGGAPEVLPAPDPPPPQAVTETIIARPAAIAAMGLMLVARAPARKAREDT